MSGGEDERSRAEWESMIGQQIREALDMFELLSVGVGGVIESTGEQIKTVPVAVNFAPESLIGENDPRSYLDLTPDERGLVLRKIFEYLGYDSEKVDVVETYHFESPDPARWTGTAEVKVYTTACSGEGMYLQIIEFPDGKTEPLVTSRDYRL